MSGPDMGIAGRVDEQLAASEYDAVLSVAAENSKYLSGAPLPFQLYYPKRPSAVLWPKNATPVFFSGADQLAGPRRISWIEDMRGYVENGRPTADVFAEMLADALAERELTSARIGFERLLMPVAVYEAIRAALPEVELVPADAFFDTLRSVKTPGELEIIKRIAEASEVGVRRALEDARAGWSERDVGGRIAARISELGADTVPMMLVGTGEGARVFGEPTDRQLEPGDFVRIDLNATLRGYYSDLGRMAVVGEATSAQRDAYAAHVEINRTVIAAMKPGVTCAEIFALEQETGARLGVELLEQPSIGFGHAIGTHANDDPKLMASDSTVLQENMVFMIEPDVIGPEGERIHLEEMVLVTADGGVLLTGTTDWSELPLVALA